MCSKLGEMALFQYGVAIFEFVDVFLRDSLSNFPRGSKEYCMNIATA